MVWSKTSEHIQIKMLTPSHEPPASFKAPNEDLQDMDLLCTFKIKIESLHSDHGYIKNQWPNPNLYEPAKTQKGTSSVLQSPKWGLEGHGCSLHLQNQNREPKFGSWLYQRPVSIFTSRSRCQTSVRTSSFLQSPKWGLEGHGCSLQPQNQDRWPKLGSWLYQSPVTIFISRSRCQTPVRNLQHPPKPGMRT